MSRSASIHSIPLSLVLPRLFSSPHAYRRTSLSLHQRVRVCLSYRIASYCVSLRKWMQRAIPRIESNRAPCLTVKSTSTSSSYLLLAFTPDWTVNQLDSFSQSLTHSLRLDWAELSWALHAHPCAICANYPTRDPFPPPLSALSLSPSHFFFYSSSLTENNLVTLLLWLLPFFILLLLLCFTLLCRLGGGLWHHLAIPFLKKTYARPRASTASSSGITLTRRETKTTKRERKKTLNFFPSFFLSLFLFFFQKGNIKSTKTKRRRKKKLFFSFPSSSPSSCLSTLV